METKTILQLLLDGRTLINSKGGEIKLGNVFAAPEKWRVKEAWYENIPKEGVLCSVLREVNYSTPVKQGLSHGLFVAVPEIVVIKEYSASEKRYFSGTTAYVAAEPLSQDKVIEMAGNAPC